MSIEIEGLDEIIRNLTSFPDKVKRSLRITMEAALLVLWENVPPYPPQPETTDYVRTGTLGRTLGVDEGGGPNGFPDIYDIREMGEFWEASFGTNLEYAPYVIGDPQGEQAEHMRYWWTLPVTVVNRSQIKIRAMFEVLKEELARWLSNR